MAQTKRGPAFSLCATLIGLFLSDRKSAFETFELLFERWEKKMKVGPRQTSATMFSELAEHPETFSSTIGTNNV